MSCSDGDNIIQELVNSFNCKTSLTNDANAAALGEKHYGVAKDMNDFIVITLGTGLGSGIFSGGRLLYGHDGFAGEMGHMPVEYDGRNCNCGNRGCLESYASASGIKKTIEDLQKELPTDEFLNREKNLNKAIREKKLKKEMKKKQILIYD